MGTLPGHVYSQGHPGWAEGAFRDPGRQAPSLELGRWGRGRAARGRVASSGLRVRVRVRLCLVGLTHSTARTKALGRNQHAPQHTERWGRKLRGRALAPPVCLFGEQTMQG